MSIFTRPNAAELIPPPAPPECATFPGRRHRLIPGRAEGGRREAEYVLTERLRRRRDLLREWAAPGAAGTGREGLAA